MLAGSFTRVVFAKKGDTLHADFGPLGGVADRHYVLEKGKVIWQGTSAELRGNMQVIDRHLGVQ